MALGEKIKAARKQKKLTQKELASMIGAAHNSVSDWENGKNRPDPDTIQNICWALDVTPNYLLGDYEEQTTPNIPSGNNIFPIGKGSRIPLYGRIACGAPILAVEDLEETAWLPEGIKADFALTCCGDSMINARIFDGDIVFIRSANSVENGSIAAVVVRDEEVTLKRLYYYQDEGRLVLRAENPMVRSQEYIGDELNHIRVLGKAIAFMSVIR